MVLREQLQVLQHELGEDGDDGAARVRGEDQTAAGAVTRCEEKLMKELHRLSKQPFGSAEGAVIRNYLDVCLDVPWDKETKERADVEQARKILDKDHYGLDKVKERILEFIAVRQLDPRGRRGKILCLVGPPGVGKTSIAMSVAKAMNRKLSRHVSGRRPGRGGHPGPPEDLHRRHARPDHRRGHPQAGSMNPLLVLDEIDKLASDYAGRPGVGPAGGAGQRTEPRLPGSLPGGARRPEPR